MRQKKKTSELKSLRFFGDDCIKEFFYQEVVFLLTIEIVVF